MTDSGHLARARDRQGTGPAPGLAALIPSGPVPAGATLIPPAANLAGIGCPNVTEHDPHPLTLDRDVWCPGVDYERAALDGEPPEWDTLKVPDGDGTEPVPLDWHYGPTAGDPDPGKMWHTGDCGGEVWVLDDEYICRVCGAQTGPDLAAHLPSFTPLDVWGGGLTRASRRSVRLPLGVTPPTAPGKHSP